jgi:chitin disaccharide deacetylase
MNPALQKLGFDARDRVVVIHADDIGMCQAGLAALAELLDFGLVSSAAVMVPCPWFPQAAAFCRERPGIDVGVHLTINAEWDAYRWGPVSTRDPASGLLDDQGYFHNNTEATDEHADPEAVAAEIRAQVDRARKFGIEPTHVDAHMGAAVRPRFVRSYVEVALEHRLPLLFLRPDEHALLARGFAPEHVGLALGLGRELEERGVPLFDAVMMMPLHDASERVAVAKKMVDDMLPGLTMLLLHPAQDTPELRSMAPDWECRVADYQAFQSPELRDHVQRTRTQVIGYRPLRDLMRAGS